MTIPPPHDTHSITTSILRTHLHITDTTNTHTLTPSQINHLCALIHSFSTQLASQQKLLDSAKLEKGLIFMQIEKIRRENDAKETKWDDERRHLHDEIYQLRNDHAEELELLQRNYEMSRMRVEELERDRERQALESRLSSHFEEKMRELRRELKVERKKSDIYEERIEELEKQVEETQRDLREWREKCGKLKEMNKAQKRRLDAQRVAMQAERDRRKGVGIVGEGEAEGTPSTSASDSTTSRQQIAIPVPHGGSILHVNESVETEDDEFDEQSVGSTQVSGRMEHQILIPTDSHYSEDTLTSSPKSSPHSNSLSEDAQIIQDLLPIFPKGFEVAPNIIHVDFSAENVVGAIVNVPQEAVFLCASRKEMDKLQDLLDASERNENLEEYEQRQISSERVNAAMSEVGAPLFLDTNNLIDSMNSSLRRQSKIASLRARAHMQKIKVVEWKKRRIQQLHNEFQYRNEGAGEGVVALKVVVKEGGHSPAASRRVSVATVDGSSLR